MPDTTYRSDFTGAQIDAAVRKIRDLAWDATAIAVSSGIDGETGFAYADTAEYPLLVFTGYKKGLSSENQRAQVIVSRASLANDGDYVNVPLAAQDGSGNTLFRTLHFWRQGALIRWTTLKYDAGDQLQQGFVATRIEGLKLS